MKKLIYYQTIFLILLLSKISIAQSSSQTWMSFDCEQKEQLSKRPLDVSVLGLSQNYSLKEISRNRDPRDGMHIRHQLFYENIPIQGAIVIYHVFDGQFHSVNGHIPKNISLEVQPKISVTKARNLALEKQPSACYAWHETGKENEIKKKHQNASYFPEGQLVIYVPDMEGENARLAYEFDVYSLAPHEEYNRMYIDAQTESLLDKIELMHHADNKDRTTKKRVQNNPNYKPGYNSGPSTDCGSTETLGTIYDGSQGIKMMENSNVYSLTYDCDSFQIETHVHYIPEFPSPDEMEDPSFDPSLYFPRDSLYTFVIGEGLDATAISAHWAAVEFFDYLDSLVIFDEILQDMPIVIIVHYGDNMENAYSHPGGYIYCGDGINNKPWVSIDIIVHEIMHEYIRKTADFVYWGESGALSEAFSDIIGIAVKDNIANEGLINWVFGDDIVDDGGLRDFKQERTFNGSLTNPSEVHENGEIINHWFYQLVEIQNVSIDTAAMICLEALNNYLTPYSNFRDFLFATRQIAVEDEELHGKVCAAWHSIGLDDPCIAALPTINIVAPNDDDDSFIYPLDSLTIKWTAENVNEFSITYKQGSGEWMPIASQLQPSINSFSWLVPYDFSTDDSLWVKVFDSGNYSVVDSIQLGIENCTQTEGIAIEGNRCLGNMLTISPMNLDTNDVASVSVHGANGGVTVLDSMEWTPNDPGSYTIKMMVEGDNDCQTILTETIYIPDPERVDLYTECTAEDCKAANFYVTNHQPNLEYIWFFGDGDTVTTSSPSVFHEYEEEGIYDVEVQVIDACGNLHEVVKTHIYQQAGGGNTSCFNEGIWIDTFPEADSLKSIAEPLFLGMDSVLVFANGIGNGFLDEASISNSTFYYGPIDGPRHIRSSVAFTYNNIVYQAFGTKNGKAFIKVSNDTIHLNGFLDSTTHISDLWVHNDTSLYIATSKGLAKYSLMNLNPPLPSYTIDSVLMPETLTTFIEKGSNNTLVIGTKGNGVMEYVNGAVSEKITSDSIAKVLGVSDIIDSDTLHVRSFARDSFKDAYYLGTSHHGAAIFYDGGTTDSIIDLPNKTIWDIEIDEYGMVWLATAMQGLVRYNPNTKETVFFNMENSNLPSNETRWLLYRNGRMWVGTINGIYIFTPNPNPYFSMEDNICVGKETSFSSGFGTDVFSLWYVNGIEVASDTPILNYTFGNVGKHRVTLRVEREGGCSHDFYTQMVAVHHNADGLEQLIPSHIGYCNDTNDVLKIADVFASYEWKNEDIIQSESNTLSMSNLFGDEESSIQIELMVTDYCGNPYTKVITIKKGIDCVYPGDTNKDGVVNHKDVLLLGLYYNLLGQVRGDSPSPLFYPQIAPDWNKYYETPEGEINLKHLDCNGDGMIGENDLYVIYDNFGKHYTYPPPIIVPPVNADYTASVKVMGIDSLTNQFKLALEIRSDSGMSLDAYGISFALLMQRAIEGNPGIQLTPVLAPDFHIGTTDSNTLSLQMNTTFFPTMEGAEAILAAVVGNHHQNFKVIQEDETLNIVFESFTGDEKILPGGDSLKYISIYPYDILMIDNGGDTIPVSVEPLHIYLPDSSFNYIIQGKKLNCDSMELSVVALNEGMESQGCYWSNGSTANTILVPAVQSNYTVWVPDSSGNTTKLTVQVEGKEDPLQINVSQSVDNQLFANVSGGQSPYYYIWDNGDVTNSTWDNGESHSLMVVDSEGCRAMGSFTGASSSSNPFLEEPWSAIYPNPVAYNENITLAFTVKGKGEYEVLVHDVLGRPIMHKTGFAEQGRNQMEFNVENWPNGVYFIILRKKNRKNIHKLIIN